MRLADPKAITHPPSVVCAETDNEAVVNNTSLQYAPVAQLAEPSPYKREALTRYMMDRTHPGAPNQT